MKMVLLSVVEEIYGSLNKKSSRGYREEKLKGSKGEVI